jgi:predicted nucleotidyltransferase
LITVRDQVLPVVGKLWNIVGPRLQISIDDQGLAALCRKHRVQEMSLFGSIARGEMRPDSDVDLLVTFKPDAEIGLIEFLQFQDELSALFGREVDLVSKRGLRSELRGEILAQAKIVYAA